jgi:hypothetical protein
LIPSAEAKLENVAGPGYQRLETEDFSAVWAGFLFLRGFVAGRDSIRALLDSFRHLGPETALAQAKGSFLLCIFDKSSRETFCCVDPFGLARLFVAGPLVSDDLFALVGALGYDEGHLDTTALAGFLRFGFYGFGRTIDRRVRFLAGDEIAVLAPGGDHRFLHKKLPDYRKQPEPFDFDAYISDVRIAISGSLRAAPVRAIISDAAGTARAIHGAARSFVRRGIRKCEGTLHRRDACAFWFASAHGRL